jgi:DNA-directed RNA polymerase specialized sigma24 family protein
VAYYVECVAMARQKGVRQHLRRYCATLHRYAGRRVASTDAEGLVAATFLAAFRRTPFLVVVASNGEAHGAPAPCGFGKPWESHCARR